MISSKNKGGSFRCSPRTRTPTPNLRLITSCRSASTDLFTFDGAKIYKLFDTATLLLLFSENRHQPSPEGAIRSRVIQEVETVNKDAVTPSGKVLSWPYKIRPILPLPSDTLMIQSKDFHLAHILYRHSAIEILRNLNSCHILLFCKFRNPAPVSVPNTVNNLGKTIRIHDNSRIIASVRECDIAFRLFLSIPDNSHEYHLVKVWKIISVTRKPVMRVGIVRTLQEKSLEVLTGVDPATATAANIAVAHEAVGEPLSVFFYFSFSFSFYSLDFRRD